jgi:hypothetical protein
LCNLKNLTVAHSYNKLQKYGLWLNGNPLKYPPKEVWRTSQPEKIFDYLKKLAIMKTEHLQRQKLIIIGESQCGKTSFVNGLVHGKSVLTNGEMEKTKLVEQTIWKTENMVDFIIYDFSGDPTYIAPSTMFLDEKALFKSSRLLISGLKPCNQSMLLTVDTSGMTWIGLVNSFSTRLRLSSRCDKLSLA